MPPLISVTILAKNSQETIPACLAALSAFPEVILLDNGSTDATISIAKSFPNVKVYQSAFIGFGALKNLAATYATHDWILSVDSDEVLSPEAVSQVMQISPSSQTVYKLLRKNYYAQRYINACGWKNDSVLRLYNKKVTAFSPQEVHEKIMAEGLTVVLLPGHIDHYSYRNATDLVQKMNFYTTLFAHENQGKKSASVFKAIWKGHFTFFRNYFLKRGILYGADGFLISMTYGFGAFYKYFKLYEANKQMKKDAHKGQKDLNQ